MMNDQINPQTRDVRAGAVEAASSKERPVQRGNTPSDMGTPRVDQGHDKAAPGDGRPGTDVGTPRRENSNRAQRVQAGRAWEI